MSKNVGKNISKTFSGKYSQKHYHHAKKSAADALKTFSYRIIQEIAEATGDLNGNKVTDGITKVSKNSQQNNSKRVTNENNEEIPKERYKSLEE